MKCLIQRVLFASVTVNGEQLSTINQGILLLLGVERDDNQQTMKEAADKVMNYRIFNDNEGKMNHSLIDIGGELLVVSQFTLAASTKKGMRPSFNGAGHPELAENLYNQFIEYCSKQIITKGGRFATDMKIELINDGPVTFLLEK